MVITILVFFTILSILVFVHELGHFLAAKKFGIKVEEFGFGLPPRLFGKKKGETIYSVNWLPIGGFVKLLGEDAEDELKDQRSRTRKKDQKRAFYARPIWQRTVVLCAGVTMNFLLAVLVISYLFTRGVMVPTNRVHIEKVLINTPAHEIGLQNGDFIKRLNVQSSSNKTDEIDIKQGNDLIQFTKAHLGQALIITVDREGKELSFTIVPRKTYGQNEGPMGIIISNYEKKIYPIWEAPVKGLIETLSISWEIAKGIGKTLWKLVTFQNLSKDVAGPIGIAQMTGEAIKFGQGAVLEMLGLLSLNLAIVNILPFPALDGGRLLFVFVEASTGRRVRAKWERIIHQIGMIVLLSLLFLVTVNDLVRIFGK